MRVLWSTVLVAVVAVCGGVRANDVASNDLHELLTSERADVCADYYYNAVPLIERWYDQGKRDSIRAVMAFIQTKCEEDAFGGLAFLMGIEDDPESVSLCDLDLIEQMLNDLEDGWIRKFSDDYFDYVRAEDEVVILALERSMWRTSIRPDLHTRIAEKIIEEMPELSAANICARWYLGQYTYLVERLRTGQLEGSCFQAMYNTRVGQLRLQTVKNRLMGAYYAGIWLPHGGMNRLGPKMEIGLQYGWHDRLVGIDLTLGLRFIKAKEEYVVVRDGETYESDYFFGGMIGADIGMEGLKLGRHQFYPFVGFAYDGFDTTKDDDENRSIGSLNVSLGGVQRFFINKEHTRYIGVHFRYNIVDYDTNGGSDLSGNAISINFVYGKIGNGWVRNARNLGLYD